MRIAIDARAFWWTGVGRYIRNLVREFASDPHGHEFVLLVPEAVLGQFKPEGLPAGQAGFELIGVERSYYSLKEQTKFLAQLYALDVDLVHFTHFNVPLLYRRPYVVTIHDITRFIFPGQKSQSLFQQIAYEVVFAHAVKHAHALIAVSQTTLNDMCHLPLRIPRNSSVIYEGVDPEFLRFPNIITEQKVRLLLGTDKPYLLSVGVWMSHKNLLRLLAAFELTLTRHPDIYLVITGKPIPGYSNVLKYVRERHLEHRVIFPGFVPHELLPALTRLSSALIFPSLYEGFGLPPLEAVACGVPVVTSNVSSMPELLDDLPIYVNPESVADIARGIQRVLHSAHRTMQFTPYQWASAAHRHIRVYENALQ